MPSFSALKHFKEYTHHHPLVKFLTVLLFFIAYLAFTIMHYGAEQGILIALLSWSFFVFCTPIADAGILVDFPLRLLTGIRMLHAEMSVWLFAFLLNLFTFQAQPTIYNRTIILKLFHHIITQPEFWPIIILSAVGTFFSIYFGDEILDIVAEKEKFRSKYQRHFLKYRLIVFLFIFSFVIMLYYFLLNKLGISIPLL